MNKDLIIAKQKELTDLYKQMAINYRDLYYEISLDIDKIKDDNDNIKIKIKKLESEIAELEQDTSLAKAFQDMDKAKDELFEAVDIICKDYEKTR